MCSSKVSDAWYGLMCYTSCNLILPALSGKLPSMSAVQRFSQHLARTLVHICTPWPPTCTPERSPVAVHSIALAPSPDDCIVSARGEHRAITNIDHHWCSICVHILCAGLQLTLASNYFGPVYLTHLLLDVLKASAPSRVVYEASLLEQWGEVNWDDLG